MSRYFYYDYINLELLANDAFKILKKHAPVDTGNLRYNAIQIFRDKKDTYILKVNGEIAPYAVYTNEEWVSPFWRGKENPNEAWVEKAIDDILLMIERDVNGITDSPRFLFEKTRTGGKEVADS